MAAAKKKPKPAKGTLRAFAVVRDVSAYEVEVDHDVPKGHDLIAVLPFPPEAGLPKGVGGVVVSAAKLWQNGPRWRHRLAVHPGVRVAIVGDGAIETPIGSGPEYDYEPVPFKLVAFDDVADPPKGRTSDRHRGSKVGGYPFHYNEVEATPCTQCGKTVVWAAHVAPETFGDPFGSCSLYIYVCPAGCEAQSCFD